MERATRDRLTGAVILVAIAAILVPEMLSGPGDDAARDAAEPMADTGPPLTTYEMSLDSASPSRTVRPAQPEPQPEPEPQQLAEAVPPPVPATAEPPAPETSNSMLQPEDVTAARATTPAPTPKPAPAAAAAPSGSWWVQVGSFASEANARGLATQVRARGFGVEVSKVRSGNRDMFAVRAGPAKDRDAAQALRSRLAAAGQQGFLVGP